ncbi:MAG: hypothetical protein ISR45_04840 [Rhodospirillales bacterium]|nr:hypothetical protein [Rhodospirillales bacterium]
MKINFDIDCTPEEARTFLGLPDVQPMQKAMMKEVEDRMKAGLDALGPDALFKTWLPAGMESFEQMQKVFFAQMGQGKND